MLYFEPRLHAVDTIYERLIAMHAGLSDAESHRANARLILLLANQLGDDRAVLETIEEAARCAGPGKEER